MEEGIRRYPYDCGTGEPVVGAVGKVTIGIGRNLQEKPLSDDAIQFLLNEDISEVLGDVQAIFPDFENWAEGRQLAIIGMVYQLGVAGFLKFHDTISLIRKLDWDGAAKQMLLSKWAKQDSPARALRVSEMVRTGKHYHI